MIGVLVREKLFNLIRTLTAVPVGYAVLFEGSTFVQETMFHGVSFHKSPLMVLILAGILTPVSGLAAGLVTAAVGGRRFLLHVIPLALWICFETTFLYSKQIVDGPLWFEGGAALALILGVFAGAFVWEEVMLRHDEAAHRHIVVV
jgi:hypothetical protein